MYARLLLLLSRDKSLRAEWGRGLGGLVSALAYPLEVLERRILGRGLGSAFVGVEDFTIFGSFVSTGHGVPLMSGKSKKTN